MTLLSAGLDSAACLCLAPSEIALTFDYGQRARERELEQAQRLAGHFGAKHYAIRLPWFAEFDMGRTEVFQLSRMDLERPQITSYSANAVWVPNRNGVFIEIAAGIAERIGISQIVVGFNREEAATFPDNSEDYITAINQSLAFSTRGKVTVVSPTASLTKAEIVFALRSRNFPWSLLWSCYDSTSQMCGRCESCRRLERALRINEIPYENLFEHPDP